MSAVLGRFGLKDKVVVLTGGTGLYGRPLTADIAGAGARLIIASRNREACERVAAEEREAGNDVHADSFDQGRESSIEELCARVLKEHGRIDGLVNNSVYRVPSLPMTVEGWEMSLKINSTGTMLMHRVFGAAMCRQQNGSIVNIGSIQGMVGPNLSLYEDPDRTAPPPDYFFHKSGMLGLTRYYAAAFGKAGVRVNCLSPGGFFNNHTEPFLTRYNNQTFLHRMANADDLGGAVIFLLSSASQYITGANLPVDGGYTAL
jgi:NAD(P)-dependent dehydrogenase (short-subunit alcohol dehydrogenase family)